MTIVSSFRPHSASLEYPENQIRAHKSWEPVVDRIVYFNKPEPDLAGPNTEFVNGEEEFPRIVDMVRFCYESGPVAAIVNADIVLKPEIGHAFDVVRYRHVGAATSRRFDLETGLLNPDDKGRDIFICKRRVWGMIAHEIPECLRIGHQQWDSWMVGFLRKKLDKKFAEFTQMRAVFHPKHEGRLMPHSGEIDASGPYFGYFDGTQDTQIA